MVRLGILWLLVTLAVPPPGADAASKDYRLTLADAEVKGLKISPDLRAATSDREAARAQVDAQSAALWPRLSLKADFQYLAEIPLVALGPGPAIPFGTNTVYAFGPTLSYTLWDGLSTRHATHGAELLAEAREAGRRGVERQVRYTIRSAYYNVQLALEELRLTHESRELARAQSRDVGNRFRAGGAARLDQVTAERAVLGYEIQFEQKQAQLSAVLKDLLSLLNEPFPEGADHPGPAGPEGVAGVELGLGLDALGELIEAGASRPLPPEPTGERPPPDLRAQHLTAEAFTEQASSLSGKRQPNLTVTGAIQRQKLNMPNPPEFTQESVAVSLTLPLFLGDPSRALAAQEAARAESAEKHGEALRISLINDYAKARNLLASLRRQQLLAIQDVTQSEDAARLYYTSYRAGRLNLIDVQNANLQSLQAKVNAARISAQILGTQARLETLAGASAPEDDSHHD